MIDWIYWFALYLYLAGGLTTVGAVVFYQKLTRRRECELRSSTLLLLYILWPWVVAVALGWTLAEAVGKCFRVR